jgi:hypothetical protein
VSITGNTLVTGSVSISGYAVLDTINRRIRTFKIVVDSAMTGHNQPTFDSIPPFFVDRTWESEIELEISDLPYSLNATGGIVVDTLVKILADRDVKFQARLKYDTSRISVLALGEFHCRIFESRSIPCKDLGVKR